MPKNGNFPVIISKEIFFFLHKMFHRCAFLGQMSLVGLLYIQINKYELPREFPVIFVKPNASLYILRYRAILRYIHLYVIIEWPRYCI